MHDAANRLAEEHIGLVERCVNASLRRMPPYIDEGAVRGAALEALVRSSRHYEPALGPFAPYAWRRMRGAIFDELRAADWHTRIERARGTRRDGSALAPMPASLDEPLNVEHTRTLGDMLATSGDFPREVAVRIDTLAGLGRLLPRWRFVLLASMVGYEDAEIAQALGVSVSRVSQIGRKARLRLRAG